MMRTTILILFWVLFFQISSQAAFLPNDSIPPKVDKVRGFFDADTVPDYVWLLPPATNLDSMDCPAGCICILRFSDASIPDIEVSGCIGGLPHNEGDLDGDGIDEIGLQPEWFSSCWGVYRMWSLKRGKWTEPFEGFATHCSEWEAVEELVQAVPGKPGKILLKTSVMDDKGLRVKFEKHRLR